MKKYLNVLVLGGSFLFLALIFATMAGNGLVYKTIIGDAKFSVYDCLEDGSAVTIIALILVILSLLAVGLVLVVELLKAKFQFSKIVLLVACGLAFVACVMFFLTPAKYDNAGLGVGAVLSAIFALISSCASGFAALKLVK